MVSHDIAVSKGCAVQSAFVRERLRDRGERALAAGGALPTTAAVQQLQLPQRALRLRNPRQALRFEFTETFLDSRFGRAMHCAVRLVCRFVAERIFSYAVHPGNLVSGTSLARHSIALRLLLLAARPFTKSIVCSSALSLSLTQSHSLSVLSACAMDTFCTIPCHIISSLAYACSSRRLRRRCFARLHADSR